MATTYILYSPTLDRYYIGHTTDTMEERMRRHLSAHRGYTAWARDWEVVWTHVWATEEEALEEVRRIKSQKSRAMIQRIFPGNFRSRHWPGIRRRAGL